MNTYTEYTDALVSLEAAYADTLCCASCEQADNDAAYQAAVVRFTAARAAYEA